MIKYLGSKRRLVPVIECLATATGAKSALDLFTGTTRVAQALKRRGLFVTAVDTARYAEVFARCYVETDGASIDHDELARILDHLNTLPGRPGYVTETFCHLARYFQPHNGERIDAVRQAIHDDFAGHPFEALLLTSLLEAADRVDSTTGVQMAYVKRWAPRSYAPLALRLPALLHGAGVARKADAVEVASQLGPFDVAYLDPPYNQHRYFTNYHVWETLVAWDAPAHYGVAAKRLDARDAATKSAFNSRRSMPAALAHVVGALRCELLILSYNDESWLSLDEITDLCSVRGEVAALEVASRRYVGAQIGVYDPRGHKVGTPGHLTNREYLVVAGESAAVAAAVEAWPGGADPLASRWVRRPSGVRKCRL